ncbi:4a-hydroxytetrahydrobiopterin dehydratase [Agromyces sp. NBRC 114283]|uniref:4a-hydroxytetrahydrobiopterin dehydratase n=1 Tax=Agromyces sp. NBRC 114283 TaxID=2994521 RepID=UPI0024A22CA4|nr:4a-hydroxytetrahydrobiopterin dehydratase [Agromyces sp. NBRC 114283]GLU90409.1 putative pterin-4-alpha-carbinolamine dehydratase [Agromyces sp. NBRC 114283]
MDERTLLLAEDTAAALAGTPFEHAVDHLVASYETGDFSAGVRLLDRVAVVADELAHHPDVHVRWGSITFELRSHDVGGVTRRDVELAQRIHALASD